MRITSCNRINGNVIILKNFLSQLQFCKFAMWTNLWKWQPSHFNVGCTIVKFPSQVSPIVYIWKPLTTIPVVCPEQIAPDCHHSHILWSRLVWSHKDPHCLGLRQGIRCRGSHTDHPLISDLTRRLAGWWLPIFRPGDTRVMLSIKWLIKFIRNTPPLPKPIGLHQTDNVSYP